MPSSSQARSPSASDEGRFAVGTVLGARFRILGLLGRGGMGEVYRAHDLTLEQQVALKFLPPTAALAPHLLERFRGEVRIARQISHRNVCRVYDLSEIDGAPFISMEYVDGEDLGSLLRRIGRLPGDKALEFARRLCAGLAAAHEKGVLHRDLKPANVMIDGRGQLLIMDFGLAAVAGTVADIGSGTPAYMAPEQREGRDVTVRSDIYALGLVLAEMFTGQRPSPDGRLSTVSKELDPAVAKVIERCLDVSPSRRPASALDVARALPGGDPLAEALAAGETPSPAMVAASEDTGALSVRAAVLCLAFVIAGVVGAVLLSAWTNPLRRTPFVDSPEILAAKARDIAQRAGYTNIADSAYGFILRPGIVDYARATLSSRAAAALFDNPRTSRVVFWYRQSPRPLATLEGLDRVSLIDPPPILSEMVQVQLDPEGRLVLFNAVPPQAIGREAARVVDWVPLFDAAGLDRAQWTPAEAERTPLAALDEQAAWSGSFPHTASARMHIDAGAWRGRPVQFELRGPWSLPTRDAPRQNAPGQRAAQWVSVVVAIAAMLLAWRHARQGRADLQGASRMAGFVVACIMLRWLLVTHHVATTAELDRLSDGLGFALYRAAVLWVLYIALEPYVRRRWPQSLISWNRLLNGDVKDPVVGSHLLVGTVLGVGYTLYFASVVTAGYGPAGLPFVVGGPARAIGELAARGGSSIGTALGIFFLFFLLRVLLRRTWVAAAVVIIFSAAAAAFGSNQISWLQGLFTGIQFGSAVAILVRFGVLPMVLAVFVSSALPDAPLTTDLSAWYASVMLTTIAIVVAIALWSFRAALGGRTVWRPEWDV